jgi:hypothetical protein
MKDQKQHIQHQDSAAYHISHAEMQPASFVHVRKTWAKDIRQLMCTENKFLPSSGYNKSSPGTNMEARYDMVFKVAPQNPDLHSSNAQT